VTAKPTIAFLGLGVMGEPMATNLARAGFPVRPWNRSPRPGRVFAESPRACAVDADIVITMLTGAEAVMDVLFGENGAATGPVRDKLFVEMSTSGPKCARRAAGKLHELGARFVDAPVSGTRGPAESGELVVLAGGSDADVARLADVFAPLARRVIHAGGVGMGQTLKVILNGMGCQHLLAFAGMLRLGEAAGLPRDVIVDAFTGGAFATPAYVGKRERVLKQDYENADFVLGLVLRDANLCAELQRETGLTLPTHRAARLELERAVGAGLADKDLFAVEAIYRGARGGRS
jgi:3-hydroxyisobutyrate dehydrogenase-like beta-hydroxyacid dehydrogenase